MGTETELKLSLPRNALARLRRHPLILAAAKSGNASTLENTYYDTPDLLLKKHGVAVRIRRQGRRQLQTVKCAATASSGLSQRPEWERPFSEAFDFSAIDRAATRKLLSRHQDELVPVFSTRFRRETRVYSPDADTRILIMIDTGELTCNEHSAPICEIELELDSGQPHDLLLLAAELARDIPVLPDDVSKSERGYRLLAGLASRAARAEASHIEAHQSPVDAFRQLAFACLRHWQANVQGAATGHQAEFIHQLRVSQRRLRSLLRLFAPALPPGFVSHWSTLLRDNGNSLGDARDLDVLCDEILAPVAGTTAAEITGLSRLKETLQGARQAQHQAISPIDPAAQGRLLLDLSIALHRLPTNNLIGAADLHTFAALQMDSVLMQVRKRFKGARKLVPAKLHALRISLKQLRYGLEFFAPLMPARRVARYIRDLMRIQDALGFIHDLDVAREQLEQRSGTDLQLQLASSFVCGWHGPRYHKLCHRTIDELGPLLKGKAPWHD